MVNLIVCVLLDMRARRIMLVLLLQMLKRQTDAAKILEEARLMGGTTECDI